MNERPSNVPPSRALIPGELLEQMFEGHPAPTFVVDGDAGLQAVNRAARGMLGSESAREPLLTRRAGDVLGCVESYGPGGCGRQERCRECVIRNSIAGAIESGTVRRGQTVVRLRRDEAEVTVCVLVSASPIRHAERTLVVLTLEDVSEVVRLQDEFRRAHQALRESEARFEALASSAPVGIVLTDERGNHVYVNPAWRQLTGLTLEQARGDGWLEAVHPEDRDAVAASWSGSVNAWVTFRGEFRLRTRNGTESWVQSWRSPLRDDSGGLAGHVGIVVDVTHRKMAEERLRQTEERLERAMKASRIGFFEWDLEAGELRHDPRFHTWPEVPNLLRGSLDEITAVLAAPEDLPRLRESIRRGLAQDTAGSAGDAVSAQAADDVRRRAPDGHVRWLRPMGVLVERHADGRPRRFHGMIADVTELTELQERVVRAEHLASIGTLVRGVCHEVNNPLASVLANVSYAREQVEAAGVRGEEAQARLQGALAEAEAALSDATESANRVREIVADLKMFASGNHSAESACDLRSAIDSAIRLAGPELGRCAEVAIEIPDLPEIAASHAELACVFGSLLANAGQAVSTRPNRVRVAAEMRDQGHVTVAVTDTGIGIDDSVLPRVFDPFFSTRDIGRGKGLGLSVCLGIVREIGGDIALRSTVGEGTTVTVVLPIARRPAPPDEGARSGREGAVTSEPVGS